VLASSKRIIIILNRLVVGGQTLDTLPLLHCLSKEFEILVLHGEKEKDEKDASPLLKKFSLNGEYIHSLKRNINPVNDIRAFLKVYSVIKRFKPQIVHTHGSKSGLIGRLAAYRAKVPVIIHTFHGHLFHSYYNSFFSSVLKRSERQLSKITSTAIAISEWQKKELCEFYKIAPAEKIKVIHLGITVQESTEEKDQLRKSFREKHNVGDEVIAIGIVGRIVPIKNLSMFVQVAAELLRTTKHPLRFFIIGDGYLKREVQELCDSKKLTWTNNRTGTGPSVIFTSWIDEIIPAILGLDIVVLTSNNEGTPMSIIEAQSCGKPVVATNVGGVRDTLIDDQTGFLVPPGDVQAMVKKLQYLVENAELRTQMGLQAREFASYQFSKQTEIENFKKLYNSAIQV
jgi:glycosyltransferase involved in cell wall biosynthesis